MNEKYLLGIILLLSATVGFGIYKLNCKRQDNIIKLLVTRDLLPAPAPDTKWIQQATCFMSDGTVGRVDGKYCMSVRVL